MDATRDTYIYCSSSSQPGMHSPEEDMILLLPVAMNLLPQRRFDIFVEYDPPQHHHYCAHSSDCSLAHWALVWILLVKRVQSCRMSTERSKFSLLLHGGAAFIDNHTRYYMDIWLDTIVIFFTFLTFLHSFFTPSCSISKRPYWLMDTLWSTGSTVQPSNHIG